MASSMRCGKAFFVGTGKKTDCWFSHAHTCISLPSIFHFYPLDKLHKQKILGRHHIFMFFKRLKRLL